MFTCSVIGNLGRDCVLQNTNAGKFWSFSIAHSRKYKDSKGNVAVETTWVDCVLDEKRGEALSPFLRKGQKVYVAGNLTSRLYRAKDGTPCIGLNCHVSQIELCGSPSDARKEQAKQAAVDMPTNAPVAPSDNPDNDNDLPF